MNTFFDSDEIEIDCQNEDSILEENITTEYSIELEKKWNKWYKNHKNDTISTTDEELKNALLADLTFLSKMSAEEYTLYRKWDEIHRYYPHNSALYKNVNKFTGMDSCEYPELDTIKSDIWIPSDINEYKNIQPNIIWTNLDSTLIKKWNIIRTFIHTQINNSNIGRNLFFIVEDKKTNKLLGLIAVSSDYLDLTPRDNYIGWSREIKTQKRMINHTAVGSTICPTQPLGFSYVGGKLMALLTISSIIENAWNEQYKDILVGMSTTSLYSSFSQYQNLIYWSKRGHSSGSIKFEPSKESLELVKLWLQKNYTKKYWEWYVATEAQGMPLKRDFKQRSLSFVYSKLKIDKKLFEANHQRGIYFCPFYKNTNEFLRMEIPKENLIRRFDNSVDELTNIWKEKYAQKRIGSLIENNRISNETLFYDDIIKLSWEETKNKYLKQVGR